MGGEGTGRNRSMKHLFFMVVQAFLSARKSESQYDLRGLHDFIDRGFLEGGS
jgi:hypothetical protein